MIFNTEFYEVFLPPYILIGIAILFSFLVTYIAIPSIVRVSKLRNLMATPNGRTSHFNPTPNLGGVAIFAGVIVSSVITIMLLILGFISKDSLVALTSLKILSIKSSFIKTTTKSIQKKLVETF